MVTVTIEERSQINEIIKNNQVCYVGMIDIEGMPYVIPMNFGFADDVIYLHSAPEGRSIESLKINPNVCITFCSQTELVYQHEQVACSYRMKGSSVICRGQVVFIDDFEEKVQALNITMKQYTDKDFTYSEPAVRNVCIWKIEIDTMTTKLFGVPYKESHKYKDKKDF